MLSLSGPRLERFGRGLRAVLVIALAVVALLIVLNARGGHKSLLANPAAMASGSSVAAAPGYLALSIDIAANARFYVVDTKQQITCVYQVNNDRLHLVSVRDFSRDTDILDSSDNAVMFKGVRQPAFEGTGGITAEQAAAFADGQKARMDAEETKRKP